MLKLQSYLLILFSLVSFSTGRAAIYETPDLKSCLVQARKDSAGIDPKDVIYVFDIDNTVLALNQNLGSVQWFLWQRKLIEEKSPLYQVADTVEGLLEAQTIIYQMSQAHTPEETTARELSQLQNIGHPVMFHTSRSTSVRNITERDLLSSHLLPLSNTIGDDFGYPGQFTYTEGPSTQRPVSFQNGVYMSAGQDKGVWLNLLFNKTNYLPQHLVFVDDEDKNIKNIDRAFAHKIPSTLCRYGKMDSTVRAFNESDKLKEVNAWDALSKFINRHLGVDQGLY